MKEVKYIPGDLLYDDGTICKIFAVEKNHHITKIEADGYGGYADLVYGQGYRMEPIPLTPKILETNGWKENEYGVYYKNFNPHKTVDLSKEDCNNWEVSIGGVTLIHCEHVHQLQHLLFGLGLDSSLKV